MKPLADLVVNLSADTRKFDRGINRASGGLKSFESIAKTVGLSVKQAFIVATGGIVAVAGSIYGLSGKLGSLASIADRAAQTGLSGAFLQRLEYAADQSGVSVETLQTGMKKLLMQMGANGEKISLIDKLAVISDEMKQATTAAERAAIGVKYFGKSGVEMTGLLSGGVGDLNALLQEAQRLGIGVDEKGLARAAAADDAIQRMKASVSALVDQVAVGMAPAFESAANKATEMIVPITQLFAKFNAMEKKWTWLKDVFVASFDVAFETLKQNWKTLLDEMLAETKRFVINSAKELTNILPAAGGAMFAGGLAGNEPAAKSRLPEATKRLNDLMAQLNAVPDQAKVLPEERPRQQNQIGIQFDKLVDGFVNKFTPLIMDVKNAAAGIAGEKFGKLQQWGDGIANWLTATKDQAPEKTRETMFAGALQKGSVEAYSLLISASARNANPQLKATQQVAQAQKKTNEHLAAMRANAGLIVIGDFA